MAFKITARTLLHLGAELISSDAVALYELIKNAFDANSLKGVQVGVTVRMPSWPGEWLVQIEKVPPEPPKDSSKRAAYVDELENLKRALLDALDATAPGVETCATEIKAAQNGASLRTAAEAANEIVIRDTGHGMSKADLNDVYLTIGTRYRRKEREAITQSGRELESQLATRVGLLRPRLLLRRILRFRLMQRILHFQLRLQMKGTWLLALIAAHKSVHAG